MTLETIRDDLGSIINQVTDSTGEFVSAEISTAEATRWINEAYESAYMQYAFHNKDRFTKETKGDVVDGQKVYTFADGSGNSLGILGILWLGLKINSTDTEYTRATPRDYPDLYLQGGESFPEKNPVYFRTSAVVSGTLYDGFELAEPISEDITDGIYMRYIKRPTLLSADADIPQYIPTEMHQFLSLGAAVKAYLKLGDTETADKMDSMFNGKIQGYFARDEMVKSDRPRRIRLARDFVNKFYLRRA